MRAASTLNKNQKKLKLKITQTIIKVKNKKHQLLKPNKPQPAKPHRLQTKSPT
jgi:hypothetical protein